MKTRILWAGLAGTAVKTIFSYLSALKEKEQVSEPELLGSMISRETGSQGKVSKSSKALTTGYAAHLLTGTGFSYCYDLLWRKGIGKADIPHGWLLGTINGLLGAVIWYSLLRLHPDAPRVPMKIYLRNMLINHMLFGITSAIILRKADTHKFKKGRK